MARGYKCHVCGRNTVQPKSVNKMVCTTCNTLYDKDAIVAGTPKRPTQRVWPKALGDS